MSAAMFDLEARNAYAMSGNYAADIYRPFAAAMPDAVWLGGSMSNPNVTERTHTQSLAIADTLGFMDDRLLVTLAPAARASKPRATTTTAVTVCLPTTATRTARSPAWCIS